MLIRLSVLLSLLCFTTQPGMANDQWPSFRNGGSSTVHSVQPPTVWSPTENIAWRVSIPGYGQSSPVIWGDNIFVTSSDGPFQQRCFVHAFDLANGKKRWSTEVQATTKVENYFRNSRAAPTCAVDENVVISFFASGDVTAMDHQGEILWTRSLFTQFGEVDNERGTASSPAQNKDLVFLVVDHHGPSYIVALNKKDGGIAWKTERGTRVPSWSSPSVVQVGGQEIVVISSSDTVDAYDASSGKSLWQIDGLAGNHIPSATISEDSVFVGSTQMYGGTASPDRVAASNCRIDLKPDSGSGFKIRWGAERANSYYSTPLAFAGYVYYVNKAGVLYCIDGESGKQVFAKRIGNPCWASAIGVQVDGQSFIYLFTKNGFTVVLRAGDDYELVARNRLWDHDQMVEAADLAKRQRAQNKAPPDQAQPKEGPEKVFSGMPESTLHQMFSYGDPTVYGAAVVQGKLLIRTGGHLYCVSE